MSTIIANRRAASIEKLEQIKDVTAEDAKQIREVWHSVANRKEAREQIDTILRTYGVEYSGVNRRTGEHVYYCNAGDTYATTIIFQGKTLTVGCWGDMAEAGLIRENNPQY